MFMEKQVSIYLVSTNQVWLDMTSAVLSSIFDKYQFVSLSSIETLWSLPEESIVIFDKGSMGNPSSQLISPPERGGHWLIVNADLVDEDNVAGFISLGYSGLVTAAATMEMLPRAVRTLILGELWFSRHAMSHALRRLISAGGSSGRSVNVLGARYELSAREQKVFTLLLQGSSNKDIAAHLNLSPSTVKTHVSNILSKTGKSSRGQLSTLLMKESAELDMSFSDADHECAALVLN